MAEFNSLTANTAVVSLSGGMDSTSLLVHLLSRGIRVFGISFDYGQKHKIELRKLEANLAYLKANGHDVVHHVLDVSSLGTIYSSALLNRNWDVPTGHYEQPNMKETVVPNRNAIFASVAYGWALSIATQHRCRVGFALGVHSGDHAIYPDCRPEFYEALIHAFEIGNWDSELVELYLPYLHGDKVTILKDAREAIEKLHLDFDLIFGNTMTSYSPSEDGISSGETGSDVERILAFHSLGLKDPIPYRLPWDQVVQRAIQMRDQFQKPK